MLAGRAGTEARGDAAWVALAISSSSTTLNVYTHSKVECKESLAKMIVQVKAEIAAEKERMGHGSKASCFTQSPFILSVNLIKSILMETSRITRDQISGTTKGRM